MKKLEFKVMILVDDYNIIATGSGIDEDLLWTHQSLINWLEDLNVFYTLSEEHRPEIGEHHLLRTYEVDEHTLTWVLLNYPNLLEPVRDYEIVRVYE